MPNEIDNLLSGAGERATGPGGGSSTTVWDNMKDRYLDAYRVARVVVGVGTTIKVVGFILAGIAAFAGLSALGGRDAWGGSTAPLGILGLVAAVLIAALGFVLGTLVSAMGQLNLATLDNAVNSSPFLTDDDRAAIFRLRRSKQAA